MGRADGRDHRGRSRACRASGAATSAATATAARTCTRSSSAARPGCAQLRGSCVLDWEENLPDIPDDVRRANAGARRAPPGRAPRRRPARRGRPDRVEVTVRPATRADVDFLTTWSSRRRCTRGGCPTTSTRSTSAPASARGPPSRSTGTAPGRRSRWWRSTVSPPGRLRVVRRGGLVEIAGLQLLPEHQSRGVGRTVVDGVVAAGARGRAAGRARRREGQPAGAGLLGAVRLHLRRRGRDGAPASTGDLGSASWS